MPEEVRNFGMPFWTSLWLRSVSQISSTGHIQIFCSIVERIWIQIFTQVKHSGLNDFRISSGDFQVYAMFHHWSMQQNWKSWSTLRTVISWRACFHLLGLVELHHHCHLVVWFLVWIALLVMDETWKNLKYTAVTKWGI